MAKQAKTNPVGRPKVDERKQSYSASLKPSDYERIIEEHESLSKAIEKEIIPNLPKKRIIKKK